MSDRMICGNISTVLKEPWAQEGTKVVLKALEVKGGATHDGV